MYLAIDSTDNNKNILLLSRGQQPVFIRRFKAQKQQTAKLLIEITKLFLTHPVSAERGRAEIVCAKAKNLLLALRGIIVVSGPGGFTATRNGVVVANTLAWSLKLKIAAVRKDEFNNYNELLALGASRLSGQLVRPFYGHQPNITLSSQAKNIHLKIKDFCAGGLVYDHGRYLLLEKENKQIVFPKGHIEPGEKPLAAAQREISEETGYLHLQPVKKLGVVHFSYNNPWARHLVTVQCYLFRLKSHERLNQLGVEWHERFRRLHWLTVAQVKTRVSFQNTKDLVTKAERIITAK